MSLIQSLWGYEASERSSELNALEAHDYSCYSINSIIMCLRLFRAQLNCCVRGHILLWESLLPLLKANFISVTCLAARKVAYSCYPDNSATSLKPINDECVFQEELYLYINAYIKSNPPDYIKWFIVSRVAIPEDLMAAVICQCYDNSLMYLECYSSTLVILDSVIPLAYSWLHIQVLISSVNAEGGIVRSSPLIYFAVCSSQSMKS